MKNNIEFLKNLEFSYSTSDLLNKEVLTKCICNGQAIKIEVISTKEDVSVVVNQSILKYLQEKNIDYKELTYENLLSFGFYKPNDYILLDDLLKDVKGAIITYIEILDCSYKYKKEREIINLSKKYGNNIIISSEKASSIRFIKKYAPNIVRGIKYKSLDIFKLNLNEKNNTRNIKIPFLTSPDFIDYDINSMQKLNLDKLKEKNIMIFSNLIDTDAKLKKAKALSDACTIKFNYND